MFWKDGLSKKLHWNMIFLVLSGKMIFIFPENMILFFRHKRKDDLPQKNTCKYDIFFKCSEKMVFPRNPHLNTIIFVTSGKMVFLVSGKYGIFSLVGKWKKMIFIKDRWKYGIFCIYAQALQAWPCPEKIHIRVTSPASAKKMIFILENLVFLLKYHIDWHPRNGPILSHWRCSTRKGVLRNFAKCTGKDLFQGFFFNKVTGLRPTTLLKRKLWCRCFPVNFAKFLRTLFVQNAHGRLLLEFQLFSILLWRPL